MSAIRRLRVDRSLDVEQSHTINLDDKLIFDNGLRQLFSSTGGEVANAQVCKTCIRGFDPRPVLQNF